MRHRVGRGGRIVFDRRLSPNQEDRAPEFIEIDIAAEVKCKRFLASFTSGDGTSSFTLRDSNSTN